MESLQFQQMPSHFGSFSESPPAPVTQTFLPPENFDRNQLFVAQMRHFIETVHGEKEPICNLEDGIMALRLALMAKESSSSGHSEPNVS